MEAHRKNIKEASNTEVHKKNKDRGPGPEKTWHPTLSNWHAQANQVSILYSRTLGIYIKKNSGASKNLHYTWGNEQFLERSEEGKWCRREKEGANTMDEAKQSQ